MEDSIIGKCRFTDGVDRDVFQTADGRQYVVDGCGLSVYGVWLFTDEVWNAPPMIVNAATRPTMNGKAH